MTIATLSIIIIIIIIAMNIILIGVIINILCFVHI